MQAIHPNLFQFSPPVQNIVSQPACCPLIDSLLERIGKVFTAIIAWIQSLFCGQAQSPQNPPTPPPVLPMPPAAPVVPPAPQGHTQQCLGFYRGVNGNAQQRTLAQIWAWDDNQLEAVHNYIQWLFPNHTPSAFNPQAPLLNDTIVQAFNDEQLLRNNLLSSFNRMLRFYGLQLDEGAIQITRAPNAAARQAVWLTPGNHNYLRMTRIMVCLRSLGFPQHAQAFYHILNDIAQQEGQNRISQQTLQFWRNAAHVA